MNLSDRIYRLRTERGLSQEELAEGLEVSRQSVSKWETGASVPELDKLVKLCDLFGVTLDELVRGKAPTEGEAPSPPPARKPAVEGPGIAAGVLAGVVLILAGVFNHLFFGALIGSRLTLFVSGPLVLLGVAALGLSAGAAIRKKWKKQSR